MKKKNPLVKGRMYKVAGGGRIKGIRFNKGGTVQVLVSDAKKRANPKKKRKKNAKPKKRRVAKKRTVKRNRRAVKRTRRAPKKKFKAGEKVRITYQGEEMEAVVIDHADNTRVWVRSHGGHGRALGYKAKDVRHA